MSATIATLGTLVCAGLAFFGAWIGWKRWEGHPVRIEWRGIKLDSPFGFAFAALGVVGIYLILGAYNQRLQNDLDSATVDKSNLQSKLDESQSKLNDAQGKLSDEARRADELQNKLIDEQENRQRAEKSASEAKHLATVAWRLNNKISLSLDQQKELDNLNGKIDELNNAPTFLRIKAAYWPRISGLNAVATYEIYDKDFEGEADDFRGAALLQFASEQYGRIISDNVKSSLAGFICEAVTIAINDNISPRDAVSRVPELRDLANAEYINVLADYTYLMTKVKLLAAESLIVVEGYADSQRATWQHPLDKTRTKITLHEHDTSASDDNVDDLIFKSGLSTIPVGRPNMKNPQTDMNNPQPDINDPQYGNEDLPNLRGGTTAILISTLVETCPPSTSLGVAGKMTVQILAGKVFPDRNKNDRKARVHLLIFLKHS
jgi:hypothetical protein